MKSIRLLFILPLFFLLPACNFTLAADVTPPPGYSPPPEAIPRDQATAGPLYPLLPPDPSKGAPIYAEKCAPCHGVAGLGNGQRAAELPNPVVAVGSPEIARQAVPSEWFRVVTQGNIERFMPPFASGLSDRQRWDVIAYAFGLSAPAQSIATGADLYQANCANCHGKGGKGDGVDAKGLAVAVRDFTDQEYMAGKSGAELYQTITDGAATNMPAYADQFSQEERWALVDYLRSLTFATVDQVSGQATPAATQEPEIATTQALSVTQEAGTITGMIINLSGGDVPAGLPISLHGFDQMTMAVTATVELKADGTFIFENIEMPVGRTFLATTEFDGVVYGSRFTAVEDESARLDLPIQVYDASTDTSQLYVDRLHYFFEFLDENTLRVVELFVIANPGTITIVASQLDGPVLTFQLPPEAANLEFQDGSLGSRYVLTDNGFGDTRPVQPGTTEIIYAYDMPYNGKLNLARPMSLDANAIVILVPEESVKVKSEQIQDAGVRDVQGVQYHMYNGSKITAGNDLNLTITGHPLDQAPTLTSSSNNSLIIGLGALGLALIVAGVWLYRRNSVQTDDGEEHLEPLPAPDPDNPETVMDAILALDDLYQAGELPEDAYIKRREELKTLLSSLMRE